LDPPYAGKTHYYKTDYCSAELTRYFIHHFDGSRNDYPNCYYDNETDASPPPEFLDDPAYEPEAETLYPLGDIHESPAIPESQITVKGTTAYVRGEYLDAHHLYQYGTPDDPLQVMISSLGGIEGLQPYTWSISFDDYTHDLNNQTTTTADTVRETIQINYNPGSNDFTQFSGDSQQSLGSFSQ